MSGTGYVYRHRVTFDETNLVGNVYFAQYVHWQGHCREWFLADHAPAVLNSVRAGELALATVSCEMAYYAECFALDELEITMTLRDFGGNRVVMDFDFRRDGLRVASGTQVVACLRRTESGTEPVELPPDLVKALRSHQ